MRDLLRAEGTDKRAVTRLIQHNVREMMNEVKRTLPFEKVANLIAIGSEARFAARALKGEGELAAVSAKDLRTLADKILAMSSAEAAVSFSITTSEAESLVPAFLAYAELIRLNPVDKLLVASASMRDGLLLQVARSIQSGSGVLVGRGKRSTSRRMRVPRTSGRGPRVPRPACCCGRAWARTSVCSWKSPPSCTTSETTWPRGGITGTRTTSS